MLVVLDEFMRECLATDVNRGITGEDVVEVLRYTCRSPKRTLLRLGPPWDFRNFQVNISSRFLVWIALHQLFFLTRSSISIIFQHLCKAKPKPI